MTDPIMSTMHAGADAPVQERPAILPTVESLVATSDDENVLKQCHKVYVLAGYRLPAELGPAARIVIEEGRRRRLVPPELGISVAADGPRAH